MNLCSCKIKKIAEISVAAVIRIQQANQAMYSMIPYMCWIQEPYSLLRYRSVANVRDETYGQNYADVGKKFRSQNTY